MRENSAEAGKYTPFPYLSLFRNFADVFRRALDLTMDMGWDLTTSVYILETSGLESSPAGGCRTHHNSNYCSSRAGTTVCVINEVHSGP